MDVGMLIFAHVVVGGLCFAIGIAVGLSRAIKLAEREESRDAQRRLESILNEMRGAASWLETVVKQHQNVVANAAAKRKAAGR